MNKDGINMLCTLVLEQNKFYDPTSRNASLAEARLFVAVVQQAICDLKYIGNKDLDLHRIGEDAKDFLLRANRVGPYLQYLDINYNWFMAKLNILLGL